MKAMSYDLISDGNITPKPLLLWEQTLDQVTYLKSSVLERLKNLGVEQIEEIYLPEEICTHSDAMSAFQRLQKPDALFGRDRSAQVAFSQSIHPSGAAVFTGCVTSSEVWSKYTKNVRKSRAREVEWDLQMEELTET
ncbi:hypothetical protein Syun_027467 [Stephania yunnanensis]|uniref:Uncharacterized protein n=1 Tax=Stephania yunnanensis TaxID=152371 RepID=A0AAP0EFM6_9MAGN